MTDTLSKQRSGSDSDQRPQSSRDLHSDSKGRVSQRERRASLPVGRSVAVTTDGGRSANQARFDQVALTMTCGSASFLHGAKAPSGRQVADALGDANNVAQLFLTET